MRSRAGMLAAIVVAVCATGGDAAPRAAGQNADAGGHPRLLLDDGTLRDLRARARKRTGEWQTLRAVCDAYRPGAVRPPDGEEYPSDGGIGPGYQGDGYLSAVYALGLCYQTALGTDATRAARYGRIGAELVSKMATTGARAAPPARDSVYGIRNYGSGLAIGYDWFYRVLDASTRARVRTVLARWIATYEREGFGRQHPQGNYFAGYYAATALAALATDGEAGKPPITWRRWLSAIHGRVRPYYARNLNGGGWPEGWNYGPIATMNQSLPVLAAKTAKGLDLTRGYRFPLGAGRFLVHFTWPDRTTLEDSDTVFENENPSATQAWLYLFQAAVLDEARDSFAPFLRNFARAVRRAAGGAPLGAAWDAWTEFLFMRGKQRSYSALPRSYLARGLDMAAVRSTWSPRAVWGAFNAGPFVNYPDAGHEYFDKGSLVIVNGRRPFLVNAWGSLMRNTPGTNDGSKFFQAAYDDTLGDNGARSLYNVFYVDRPAPPGQDAALRSAGARTRMSAFEDRGGAVYMRGSDLEDQYPRRGSRTISSWTREVVYVRPGTFVVRDRTEVTDPSIDAWLAFHFGARPQQVASDGGATAYDVGSGATFAGRVTTVLPAGHSERVVDVFDSGKAFRLEVRGLAARGQTWLTAFDASATPASAGRAVPFAVSAGSLDGVLLDRPAGDDVAVAFARAQPVSARYRVAAGATRHVVAGLRPGARYAVTATAANGGIEVSLRPGSGSGARAATRAGVLRFGTTADGRLVSAR